MGKTIDKQCFTRRLRDATWIPAFAGKAAERAEKTEKNAKGLSFWSLGNLGRSESEACRFS
jgi:hypothetical protein